MDRGPQTRVTEGIYRSALDFIEGVGRRAQAVARESGTSVDGLMDQVRWSFVGVNFLKFFTFWVESVRF